MKNSNGMWLRGLCAVLALGFSAAQAATGVWVNVTGGYWAEAGNWQDGFVPSGAPDVADFSALGSGETVTVTNDTGIGAMVFSGGNYGHAGVFALKAAPFSLLPILKKRFKTLLRM